ncbi:diaminopimelate epimerase [Spirochaetota bacterium]
MKFTKMHGLGNDYIYINCFKENVNNPRKLAQVLSDRHFGIGGDGIILICPSKRADAKMRMFNADGSEAEMCGNGVRCMAAYLYENSMVRKRNMHIETLRGILSLELFTAGKHVKKIKVDMGTPIIAAKEIPVAVKKEKIINEKITILKKKLLFTSVSMGNPHCVIYVKDVISFPVEKFGPRIEHHRYFPKRTNVEFVEIISRKEVIQRTWERGSGETFACGTGASAVCVAGVLTNKTDTKIVNHLRGGDLELQWNGGIKDQAYMTGGVSTVFSGEIKLENIG